MLRLSVLFLLASMGAAFAADPLSMTIDESKVVRLPDTMKTVVLGNPAIADVTIKNDKLLILTGMAPGSTNLIVLNDKDEPIMEQKINVIVSEHVVTVQRNGTVAMAYACRPSCRPTVAAPVSADAARRNPAGAGNMAMARFDH
jgi:Flp pilus assembly secretin CpaC